MNRRYLAHACGIGKSFYTRSTVEVTSSGLLVRVFPFTEETSHTVFYDGILLFTSVAFRYRSFIRRFREDCVREPELSFSGLLLKNSFYLQAPAVTGEKCLVWQFAPVNWTTGLPETGAELIAV